MKTRTWYGGIVAVLAATSCVLASSAGARTLAYPTASSIAGIKPTHAVAGQRVLIFGSNLDGTSGVTFGGVPAKSVVVDPSGNWVRAVVPAGAPIGQVPVTLDLGGSTTYSVALQIGSGSVPAAANRPPSYTSRGVHAKVVVAPRISGFSPAAGHVGARVMISGANLNGTSWLKFGGVRAQIMHSSASSIIALVPKHAHTGKLTVHARGGTSVSVGVFRVLGRGAGV